MTELERDILSIIKEHRGEEHKINQKEIMNEWNNFVSMFDEPDIDCRRVRRVIVELIKQGYPIISTPSYGGGYWWANEGESLECYRRLRRQGIRILLRARDTLRNSRVNQLNLSMKGGENNG